MNHYCTYFDRGFLIQGLALAASLRRHDPDSLLWVLCLDDYTSDYLEERADSQIRPLRLADLEDADPELCRVKDNRTRIEYYFTLSPCLPRHLLQRHPEIDRITYVDADLFFFDSPAAIFAEMDTASVLVTEHRYPFHLRHHARYGIFNVGLLSFRNDAVARDCLDWWRQRCLDWCYDREENGKYGDQKYLDEWPRRYGSRLCVLRRRGANLAPWNWSQYRFSIQAGRVWVDDDPLEVFHFARFAPLHGSWMFQSGQLEYGVMPWPIRQAIYGRYWSALREARDQIQTLRPDFDFPHRRARGWHGFWRVILPRAVFGSDWIRLGPFFISGRLSLGRYSGRCLSWIRSAIGVPVRRLLNPPAPVPNLLPADPLPLATHAENAFAAPPQQRE